MGFYGHVTNTQTTQFNFDKIYPNFKEMNNSADSDGVFIGRYVLINYNYDDDGNYIGDETTRSGNLSKDEVNYNYTVWQKFLKTSENEGETREPAYRHIATLKNPPPDFKVEVVKPGDFKTEKETILDENENPVEVKKIIQLPYIEQDTEKENQYNIYMEPVINLKEGVTLNGQKEIGSVKLGEVEFDENNKKYYQTISIDTNKLETDIKTAIDAVSMPVGDTDLKYAWDFDSENANKNSLLRFFGNLSNALSSSKGSFDETGLIVTLRKYDNVTKKVTFDVIDNDLFAEKGVQPWVKTISEDSDRDGIQELRIFHGTDDDIIGYGYNENEKPLSQHKDEIISSFYTDSHGHILKPETSSLQIFTNDESDSARFQRDNNGNFGVKIIGDADDKITTTSSEEGELIISHTAEEIVKKTMQRDKFILSDNNHVVQGITYDNAGHIESITTVKASELSAKPSHGEIDAVSPNEIGENQKKYYVLGTKYEEENAPSILNETYSYKGVYIQNNVLQGAGWNDYAEYRETDNIEAGRCVIETGKGDLVISSERLQPGAEIVSDTYGFAIGQSEKRNTPIAVSGRVLAYPFENIKEFAPGDPVCSGPNGTISKMTREEVREYPDRIIGTISEIPDYSIWDYGLIPVKGRVWVRVR